MDVALTVFWGVVVLLVLVVVHELGHFIAARAFGVRVTEFMIGMPGPNIGFEHNGCRYGITCIPLGGYNRITGMEGGPEDPDLEPVLAYVYRHGKADVAHVAAACNLAEDDAKFSLEVLDGWGSINKPGRSNKTEFYCAPKTDECELGEAREVEDPKALLDAERACTYRGLSLWKREVVLFAGPVMNILLAVVVFLVMFCGMGVEYATTTIDSVAESSPAASAGLQQGDTITAVDGTQVESLSELSSVLNEHEAGDSVAITYERDGQSDTVDLALEEENGRLLMGIYAKSDRYKLSPPDALVYSGQMLVATVQSYAMLFNPTTSAEVMSQSSSIVGISVVAKRAADAGLFYLLYIVAIISLSLGVVNLLPVPPLDGGKIVTEVIQKVSRRDVSVRLINYTSFAVIAALLVLFVVLTQQDISNYVLGASS